MTNVPAKVLSPFLKQSASYREFLPAALEILETPPSPIRMSLMLTICALAAATLVWSYFGRLDIIAVAQGKIQPVGRVKIIQPLETGKVVAVKVENGQHVAQGDELVELDANETRADEAAARAALASFEAESLRRRAALDAAEHKTLSPLPEIAWPDTIPQLYQDREARVLAGDIGQLLAAIASFDAQTWQKQAEQARLTAMIAAQEALLTTLGERVTMRSALVARAAGSKADLMESAESRQYQEVILATQKGQLAEAIANLAVIAGDREKAIQGFIAENAQKLAEAERQVDENRQKLAKARAKSNSMILRSPISGTVAALSVNTVGQVISTGEEVMRLVPEGSPLEVECYLQNKDIGFVKPDQEAVVKIESFPFIRYGALNAKVIRVARDAIPEPDVEQAEANPATPQKANVSAGAQRTHDLVFPVTLVPETQFMAADGVNMPLSSGMTVSVEIKTGSRKILEYIFSPLVEVASEAWRER